MNHTPGPWLTGNRITPINHPGHVEYDVWSKDTYEGTGWHPKVGTVLLYHTKQAEADARLIAAAPDLLAACRAALEYVTEQNERLDGPMSMPTPLEEQLDAAIAAAEGR